MGGLGVHVGAINLRRPSMIVATHMRYGAVENRPCHARAIGGARKSRSRLLPPPASFHAGCQGTRSVESPWLAMEFIAGSRLLLSRSRLRLYRNP